MKNIQLLLIDPQNDFCNPSGSLYVPGAEHDIDRLAGWINKNVNKINDIHVTLDSHRKVDISHPIWWKDSAGNNPAPFTIISAADMKSGAWRTTQPSAFKRTLAYLEQLEATQRYPHVIWPEHCLIGSEGHGVAPNLFDALQTWEARYAMVGYVTKGSNPYTEHFSGVRAEVPDPNDPTTQINLPLINTLENADLILIAGQARSHCVANTVRDIANTFSNQDYVKKLVLLEDCMSDVGDPPGTTMFSDMGKAFVDEMVGRGMRIERTDTFLR